MELYGEHYYRVLRGPLPYHRSEPHWRSHFARIADAVVQRFAPGSVLDAGCAMGLLVEALRERGIEAFGIDLSAYAISQVRQDLRPFCAAASITDPLDRTYDLITCLDVLEHLTAAGIDQAIANLCAHTTQILFSSPAAELYDPTHVTVRPSEFWARKFAEHGFQVDRSFDASGLGEGAMLFRRGGAPSERLSLAYFDTGTPREALEVLRMVGPMAHLAKRGAATLLRGLYSTPAGRELSLGVMEGADVVVMQRGIAWQDRLYEKIVGAARQRGLPVVYELDDLLFEPPAGHPHADVLTLNAPRTRRAIGEADAVVVSTDRLAEEVRLLNPRVFVLQNSLDDHIWEVTEEFQPEAKETVTIGYAATPTHGGDIDVVASALKRIAAEFGERVRFCFLGCVPAYARELGRYDEVPFSEDYVGAYPRALLRSGLDIALAPLEVNRFNRAKSHIKYLEYSAVGAAGIYTDLDPYSFVVRNAVNGLLVPNEPDAWHASIRLLVEHRSLRETLVRNARRDVARNWMMSRRSEEWLDTYREIARGGGRAARTGAVAAARGSLDTAALAGGGDREDRPLVSIVIPTYNKWQYTERCLKELSRNTTGASYEVIVVDNASTDETREKLRIDGPGVRVHLNEENLGFAKACNQGAALARGKYILFLNNDTEPLPGWLEPMVEIVERDPAVSIVGSKLLFPDGTIQHAGVAMRYAEPHPLAPVHIAYRQPADASTEPLELDLVTGACLLIRDEAFRAVGGFDEGYVNGYEDVDLCLKVRQMGGRVRYTPDSVLVHHESVSEGRFAAINANVDRLHRQWLGRVPSFARNRFAGEAPVRVETDRPRTSLVVVTRNSLATVAPCLESLLRFSGRQDEVLVVDDGSDDATPHFLEWIAAREPDRIRVIRNDRFLGFGAAASRALEVARGEYVAFVQPDVEVEEGWLHALLTSLQTDPSVGAISPAIRPADSTGAPERPPRPRLGARETLALREECFVIRRQLLRELGGLDAELRAGAQHLDLSWRLREEGLRLLEDPDVVLSDYGIRQKRSASMPGYGYIARQSCNLLYEKVFCRVGGEVPAPSELWGIEPGPEFQTGLASIVILIHNNLELSRQCIHSVYEHTHRDFELILVDNASSEDVAGFAEELKRTRGNVTFIRNAENEGYAYGSNQGLARARGEYVVLLNNDVIVTPGWLSRQLALLSLDPRIGLVGPRTNYTAGPQIVEGVPYSDLTGMYEFAREWAVEHAGEIAPLSRITGLCMVMRRELVDTIGGFDTCFGIGNFEDDDLCLRAQRAGFLVMVANDVFIHHYGSATFRALGVDYARLMEENFAIFRDKWSFVGTSGQGYRPQELIRARAFDPARDRIPADSAEIFHAGAPPIEIGELRPVRLLCIPDGADPGWEGFLATYLETFDASDPVSLIIRVEPPLPERVEEVVQAAERCLAAAGRAESEVPDVVFEVSPIAPAARGGLYTLASAFVSTGGRRDRLFRREAAACGLRLLASPTPDALRELVEAVAEAWGPESTAMIAGAAR